MKKITKLAAVIGILISLVFSCVTGAAAARTDLGSRVYINSASLVSPAAVTATTGYTAAAGSVTADFTVDDYQSFVKTVEHQYLLRNPGFTVRYNASRSSLDVVIETLMNDVFSYDDPTTTSDLDYLLMNIKMWKVSGTIYTTALSSYAVYQFSQAYLTTADQEDEVNASVGTILRNMNVGTAGAYAKIKTVHDYVVNNVDYDDTLTRFTAYDALSSGQAVCQGYALLTYKLLTELNIPVRFISGTTTQNADGHAWNIVKLGQYWYNLDVTWDDTGDRTRYFLRNNAAFSDHIRDGEYATAAFNQKYPMSPTDFSPGLQIQAIAFAQSDGIYDVGDTFTLTAALTPADAAVRILNWSSSNPAVAVIDSGGRVTVTGTGTAVLTAKATDGGGASAAFTLTAHVSDTPSSWAKAGIDALTARGVITASLMSNWRSTITRAEFTALMLNVYEYAKGPYVLTGTPLFSDIAGTTYMTQIAKAYELGIVNGTGGNMFTPDGSLTREQCAKLTSTVAGTITGIPVISTAALPYTDAGSIDGWALGYVRYAYENGLMTGTGSAFEPFGLLTREQAMLVAERMIEKYQW